MDYVDLKENLDLAYQEGSRHAVLSGRIKLGPNELLDNYDEEETRWYWKGFGDAMEILHERKRT